jgi:hypothetical protein
VEAPRLIPERRASAPAPEARPRRQREAGAIPPALAGWIAACRGGKPSPGNFVNAGPISEAVNLYAVALRTRQRLLFDAGAGRITNVAEANRYLSRQYRAGWDPRSI